MRERIDLVLNPPAVRRPRELCLPPLYAALNKEGVGGNFACMKFVVGAGGLVISFTMIPTRRVTPPCSRVFGR